MDRRTAVRRRERSAKRLVKDRGDASSPMALLVDAKNETSLARTVLAQAAKGSIRTETLRAFTEDEYRRIIGSLP